MATYYTNSQNTIPKPTFNSQFKIDGMGVDEWVNANSGKNYSDFYNIRVDKVQQALEDSLGLSKSPVNLSGVYSDVLNANDYTNYINFNDSLQKAKNIASNNGRLIGFDTETIGSLKNPILTEIGYSEINVNNGSIVGTATHSMPLQLTAKQGEYLNSIRNKFYTSGMDSLSSEEKTTLEWASRYGNLKYGKNIINNNGVYEITSLNTPSYDRKAIDSAYEYLTAGKLGNKNGYINSRKTVNDVVDFLYNSSNDSNTALYIANGKFDTNALYQELISQDDIKTANKVLDLKKSTIDTISVDRVNASMQGISPGAYLSNQYGVRVSGADVENQMKARLIPNTHTHISGFDSLDEGYVLYSQLQGGLSNVDDVLAKAQEISSNSVFYFHHGALDQSTGREFGIINGAVTPNVGITQDFWVIDKSKSGQLDNGLERLTFTNYTDIKNKVANPVQFSIERSHEDIADFLNRNALIQSKSDVNKRLASGTQELKYKDIANREFKRMLDSSAVTSSKDPHYLTGYDRLKSYLGLKEKLGLDIELKSNTESLNALSDAINNFNAANPNSTIKMTGYEMQAYLGMQDLLTNERSLIESITNTIDSKEGLDNMQKTIMFSKAYDSAIEELETISGGRTRKRVASNIKNIVDENSVVFDIDGEVYRINTMNEKTKVNSINNILNSMSYNTDSMGKGGVVDTRKVSQMLDILGMDTYVNPSSDFNYDLAQNIASLIPNGAVLESANPEDTIASKLTTALDKKYSTGSLEDIYIKNKARVDGAVAESIATTPYLTYADNTLRTNALDKLARDLNYNFDKDNNPIIRLFTNKNGYDANTKNGLISILVTPESDKSSAYVLTTRQQDYGKLADKISKGQFDFSSWKSLKSQEDSIFNYAMVTELPYIHKYNLDSQVAEGIAKYGIGTLTAVEQGAGNQRFVIPTFNTYTDYSTGALKGYINSGEFEVIRSYDKTLKKSMEYAAAGDYSRASSVLRQPRDAYLSAMSSSSTYYNTVLADGSVKRILNFSPSDYLQAFRMNLTGDMKEGSGGLYSVFGALLDIDRRGLDTSIINPNNISDALSELTEAQRLVYYAGQSMGKSYNYGTSITSYIDNVYQSPEFKELFLKDLFLQSPSEDIMLASKIDERAPLSKGTIFDLLYSNKSKFDTSISTSLDKIYDIQKQLGELPNQIISESALSKGDISLGVTPGSYNPMAPLNNTMRPQYAQSLNPVMFKPDELVSDNLFGVSSNQGTITKKYLEQRKNLIDAFAENTPIGMEEYAKSQTGFTAKVTLMSDYDLQRKYLEKSNNAINNALGLSEQEYRDVLEYMSREYSSFAEDKTFISPALAETDLFSKREAKKIEFNLEDIDIDKTRKLLMEDTSRVYDINTPIAISKSGKPVFKNTTGIILDEIAIDELLETGRTFAPVAAYGDTMDTKLTIGYSEKTIAHAISTDSFANYMISKGYTNYDKQTASRVANAFFEDMFGASIVGDINFGKHGNMGVAMSYLNAMEQAYRETGELVTLVNILNSTATKYEGINPFSIASSASGDLIVVDWEKSHNLSGFISDVYSQLTEYNIGNAESNNYLRELSNSMQYSSDKGYSQLLLNVQRQSVNEHMGKALNMDWRMQQGILARGIDPTAGELDPNNRTLYELLREYSGADTANAYAKKRNMYATTTTYFNNFDALQNAINSENIARNGEVYTRRAQQNAARNTARGISLVNDFATDPNNFNDFNRVIDIDSRELLKLGAIPENIENVKELETGLFSIDGRASQRLKELSREQGVVNPYALRLNLGKEIEVNGKSTNSILIPIQNINTIGDNEAFYSKQATETRRFLNKVIEDIKNPTEDSANKLGVAYQRYTDELVKQFSSLDKNSDIVRYITEFELPNSTFALGQDEASMLTLGMLQDKDINETVKLLQKTREELRLDPDLDKIKLLDTLEEKLSNTLEGYAKKAETGELIDVLASNMSNRAFDVSYLDIDGKRYFAPVVAVSEDTLKAMHLNLSEVGMQTLLEYEVPKNNGIYIPDKYFDEAFQSRRTKLINELNKIEGLNISESDDVLKKVNLYLGTKYGDDICNIASLNKARLAGAGDDITAIFNAFQDEGRHYMERVGTYGLYNRYPSFRSYPIVKYTLDTSMQGKQMRFSNGLFSVISNIDFDGDIAGAQLLLEGSGIARESNALYQAAEKEYLRYTTQESGSAIAELIRNADAFKYGSTTIGEQLVEQLKIANKSDIIDEAINVLGKSDNELFKGITREAINSSKGLALAVFSSKEFLDIANDLINKSQSGLNMVTDKSMQVATLAAEIRKADIGFVSTSSFKARDNLLRALNGADTYDEKYKILQSFKDLSNMESKFGGLFSAAEQNAIDTKKALDGLMLSVTSQYSEGLSYLTRNADTLEGIASNRYRGTQRIFNAVGENIFKDVDPARFEEYSKMVAGISFEEFDKYVKTLDEQGSVVINGLEFTTKNRNELTSLRGLRGLSETALENDYYKLGAILQKGGSPEKIKEELAKFSITNEELADNLKAIKNSSLEPLEMTLTYNKGEQRIFEEGMLYFTHGDVNKAPEAYVFKNNAFREVSLASGNVLENGGIVKRNIVGDISGVTSLFEFTSSETTRKSVQDRLNKETVEYILSGLYLDKNIAPTDIPISSNALKDAPLMVQFSRVKDIANNGNYDEIINNVDKISKAYDLAVRNNMTLTSAPGSGADLIRQLNKAIADNPDVYSSKIGTYDEMLEAFTINFMKKGSSISDMFETASKIGDLDFKQIDNAIASIKDDMFIFDINETRNILNQSFDTLQEELNALKSEGISKEGFNAIELNNDLTKQIVSNVSTISDKIKNRETIINSQLASQEITNKMVGYEISSNILDMFKTTEQMDEYFKFGTKDAKVAFTEYIGQSISDLSKSDINYIREAMQNVDNMSDLQRYAYNKTLESLEGVEGLSEQVIKFRDPSKLRNVDNIVKENFELAKDTWKKVGDLDLNSKQRNKLAQEASKIKVQDNVNKRTLGDAFSEGLDGLSKILTEDNLKKGGIAAGILVGIGVAGKMLHKRTGSPLSPKTNHPEKPSIDNSGIQYEQPQQQDDSQSKKRTVYMDKESGLQFKVSAKTRNSLNYKQLANAVNNGNSSSSVTINTKDDTSKITDNWLANKFAQLSQ